MTTWDKKIHFRLTRAERFLLLALFVIVTVQVVLVVRMEGKGAEKFSQSTWEQQETAVQERINQAALLNREDLESRLAENPSLRWKIEVAAAGSLIILFGSLAGLIWVLVRLFQRRPVAPPLGSPGPPTWGARDIFRLILTVLVMLELVGLVQWVAAHQWNLGTWDRPTTALVQTLLIDLIIVGGACWIFLRGTSPSPLRREGKGAGIGSNIRYGVFSYVTFLPVLALLVMAVAVLVRLLDQEPPPQPIFTLYFSESRAPVLTWILILVTLAGPIAEELFFRGLVYGWLRHRIGITRGLLLASFLFAAIHVHPVSFLPIFALGCLFCWLYEKTGSLVAPITAHIFHNVGMLYLAFLVKSFAQAG